MNSQLRKFICSLLKILSLFTYPKPIRRLFHFMHEMTLAQNILEIIYDAVPHNEVSNIDSVEIDIGILSNVMEDSLSFCFNSLKENTPAAGAKLIIRSMPVKIKCLDCGNITEKHDFIFTCSVCSGNKIEVIGGNELRVSSINMKELKGI